MMTTRLLFAPFVALHLNESVAAAQKASLCILRRSKSEVSYPLLPLQATAI